MAMAAVAERAMAQSPEAASDLPPLVVEGKQPKKSAKKASAPAQAETVSAPAEEPEPAADVSTAESGGPNQGSPGLNLSAAGTSGSRLGLTPLETPASVDVISGETARQRGQFSTVEAVTQNAPGFSSVAMPVFGTAFAARGFQGNNSVMQLYDGTRLFPGRGNITFPFNMWSVERIEVLHGPASVLYGEGAIGGIINVIPKKPITEGMFNEAQIFYDSNMTRRASLDSGGAISKDVSYRFNVSADASDGWIDDGDSENLGISGALRWQAAPGLVFSISHDYGKQEPMAYFGTPFRNGALVPGTRDENYNVRDNILEFRDSWTQFKTEWTPSQVLSFRNVAYYLDSRREFMNADNPIWNTATDEIDLYGSHILQKQDQIGNRFDATLRTNLLGSRNETVVGFDVNRGRFAYSGFFIDYDPLFGPIFGNFPFASVDPFDPERVNFPAHQLEPRFNSELRQASFFAENRLEVNRYLSLVGGVRWDDLNLERDAANPSQSFEKEFHAFNWRAGAVVTPLPGLAFFGQYAVATDPLNVPLLDLEAINSDFDLTRGRQVEIGVKQSLWNGAFEWSLSAYDIVKTDLLVATSLTQRLQIGQQSSRGIEAAIGVELGGGWRVDANGALVDAQYDEFGAVTFDINTFTEVPLDFSGKRPFLVPEKLGNVWVSWAFAPNWLASVGVQYVGSSYENPANTIERPSYTVTNVGLQWRPLPSTTLDFRVKNVFDEVYAQYLSVADPLAETTDVKGWIAPPRTFEAAMSVRF
jgi:iron complex outermembrane receptor protein